MKILMVCLGNICRSPLAEGIMKQKLADRNLVWEVDSAGTGSWHIGQPPDPRSIAVAGRNGIDISNQRARQFSATDLERFDLILAMDKSNYRDILARANGPFSEKKLKLMLDFLPNENNREVPDPYWNDDGFEQVFDMLEKACEQVIYAYNEAP